MVKARRGASSLGCLTMLLLVAAAVYFGLPVGEAYWRFYRYEDEMKQVARFAGMRSDEAIRNQLKATADSLGLPEDAKLIGIERLGGNRIVIGTEYDEEFHLPGTVRVHTFRPHVEVTY